MAKVDVYIRFGEIPENERSKIYRDDEILKELPKYKKFIIYKYITGYIR